MIRHLTLTAFASVAIKNITYLKLLIPM